MIEHHDVCSIKQQLNGIMIKNSILTYTSNLYYKFSMEQEFGDIAKNKKIRINNRVSNRDFKRACEITAVNNLSKSPNSVRSLSETRQIPRKQQTIQKGSFKGSNKGSDRNVRFSQKISHHTQTKKKHHSSSILKKTRYSSMQRRTKTRSDSVNSLAGQNPHKDDQSCQNSNLNKIIKEEYLAIIESFGENGNYIDDIFPPVISSLFSYAARKKHKLPDFKWKRIGELFPESQLVMWSSDLSKVMVQPSTQLASDYFILGLNCIKSSKSFLRFMFESQQPNPQGIYYVKIFQGNMWKFVLIDDYIPVIEETKQSQKTGQIYKQIKPAFLTVNNYVSSSTLSSNSSSNRSPETIDIWPFLIEKAFAKIYSSYEALQNGNIYDFIEELTNKPYEFINLDEEAKNLKQKFKKANDLIGFAETDDEKKVPLHIIGPSRIYFTLPNRKPKIIDIEQLPKYFQGIYLTGTHSYTYYGYCPIRQIKQSISVRCFQLKNAANFSLSVFQKDQKFFQINHQYQYSWIRVIVLQKEFNAGYRWIDGRYDNTKSLHVQAYLEAGQYYILIMPEWEKKAYDLNLIVRTKAPTRIQRRVYQDGMIEEGCTDLAQRFGKLNQHNNYICSYNCIHEPLGLIIQNINNQRTRGHIRIVRSIQGLKSTQQIEALNRQFRKNKMIQVKIRAGQHYTVVLVMRKGIDQEFFKNFDFQGQ